MLCLARLIIVIVIYTWVNDGEFNKILIKKKNSDLRAIKRKKLIKKKDKEFNNLQWCPFLE